MIYLNSITKSFGDRNILDSVTITLSKKVEILFINIGSMPPQLKAINLELYLSAFAVRDLIKFDKLFGSLLSAKNPSKVSTKTKPLSCVT